MPLTIIAIVGIQKKEKQGGKGEREKKKWKLEGGKNDPEFSGSGSWNMEQET
jgi:hypothetical protein